MPSIRDLLLAETCGEVVGQHQRGKLIAAKLGEPVHAVALRLAQNKISALPVFDAENSNIVVGVIDYADIVSFILSSKRVDADGDAFWEHLRRSVLTQHMIGQAHKISSSDPLLKACDTFATVPAAKRLLVMNGDGVGVLGLLSPSLVCRHLVVDRVKGGQVANTVLMQPVSKLFPSTTSASVASVTKQTVLIEAMQTMLQLGQTCLPVVDDGVLCGSVSLSDVKLVFSQQDYAILAAASCWDCIVLGRNLLTDVEQYPFIGVGQDTVLLNVIHKLLATQVHNLYVVDKHDRPTALIGFPAVCAALLL